MSIPTKALPDSTCYWKLIFKLGGFIILGLALCIGAVMAFRQVTSFSCPRIGTVNNKSIFAEQARRISNIKSYSPETQVKTLAGAIEGYVVAVREVSKAHNVILFDKSALATEVSDYTREVEDKLFGKKTHE